jgi:endoglucanase
MQTFVDTVRATGGNNAYRNLIIQGYRTDIKQTVAHLKLPKDKVIGRLLTEVHFYDPWDFCGEGGNVYLWGSNFAGDPHRSSWGQEDWIEDAFGQMKTNFVDKGVPVIIGEYSAMYRALTNSTELARHKTSRIHFLNTVTRTALKKGIVPIYWDNGNIGDKGNGLFDRKNNVVVFVNELNAITGIKKPAPNRAAAPRPRVLAID